MLIANIPPKFATEIEPRWKSIISSAALVIILARAGMGLDVAMVKSRWALILWVSLIPNIVDIGTGMGCAVLFFKELPLIWCALVGFILPAVSPAVVVPAVLALQKEGYGVTKGVTTVVLAATALGDVFSIAGFSVCMSFVFAEDTSWWTILKVFVEIFAGISAGALFGTIVTAVFPSQEAQFFLTRSAILCGFGGAAVFGGKEGDWNAAGSLFVLVFSTICAQRWSQEITDAMKAHFVSIWNRAISPLLFGLVGAGMDFSQLSDIGYICALIAITSCVRLVSTTFATPTKAFTWWEKGFMACAWLPRATVQAALAPLPLSRAKGDDEKYARIVLAVGVLSIVLTAPTGALLIRILGPRWLTKPDESDVDEKEGSVETVESVPTIL